MKTLSKDHLPEVVHHNGKEYFRNADITHARDENNTPLDVIAATLRKEGRYAVVVKVLDKNLRGKLDLHQKPYKAHEWIYTTKPPTT